MIESDLDDLDPYKEMVPKAVFGHAAEAIEHELNELLLDLRLAGDYPGDYGIEHAIQLTARVNTLQTYLFVHLDLLLHVKKMKAYAEQADKK
jgi:hypothetical protein